jgi:murein L,D-transpeptidase YcbB/YkuD
MSSTSFNYGTWMRSGLLAFGALLLCAAAPGADPVSGWSPARLERLKYWVAKAPEDALPQLDAGALDRAQASGDTTSIDTAATELALRLARMHLLGCSTPAQRAGWHIVDSDSAIDLRARLERAVLLNSIDAFFTGLEPKHPDYAALREAYARETDPELRRTLARNMERWRWMPQSPGQDYVLVNAPAFEARLWRDGEHAGTWKVIVGKRSTPTPVFSATITGVILNPWWVVPASIMREMRGRFPASKGYVWSGGQVRQKPGPNNALGQMKLDMPNPYTVYMHDTPAKHLFERDIRAFSHGCIRVGDALGLATTLLQGIKTREELDAIVATRKTTTIELPAGLPVYIAYFTAGTDRERKLAFYPDIYGRDSRLGDAASAQRSCGM